MHLWVLIAGLVMLAAALPVAGRRVLFLGRLITSGQPAPDRVRNVTQHFGDALRNQLVEVLGQKKLLKWSVPGAAHFFVFWAFLILGSVYLEAFGVLFSRNPAWHIPIVGRWDLLGFAQDFIAVMCLVGLATFAGIRLKNAPERLGRRSRFSGSHLGGAWVILGMIFNVIWTMLLFRGAGAASGNLPYGNGAFASHVVGRLFGSLSDGALEDLEGIGLLLHIGVMLAFLVIVLNSKHLHIFVAPLNVAFGRHPVALGAVKPLTVAGQPVTLDDIEDIDESTALGIGSIEDFSWKGMLDFATCTECGRCQSQCPAWNTEKPLSPKLLIMNLRDHAFEKAPYLLADPSDREALPAGVRAEADRALVGATEGDPAHPSGGAVIDDDVLWSCVTCGACVEQCPVDIEHVDHIVDMRRYQVLVESNFPAELNQLFKGMENKGNPWNMSPTARMDWAKGLDFDVKVVGAPADEGGVESLDEVEWLFWVGCAGAYEDRAKKTTRAVAELLNIAGVDFAVLGNGETCSGDQARRAGNEFVFQGLAQQNAETFKEFRVTKVVSTCAHCFNTLKNEYQQFGVELEVVHHTQLLNRLVREGRLTPVQEGAGAHKRSITYHDPCYIGRHNGVYSPPRELLQVLPGAEYVEMERNSERSFCCGAGGARMWMEENLGTRINVNRTNEAIGTGADQIAVGCPFCRVMLSDGLTAAIDQGEAREEVEVLDVAQMLLASVKGEQATKLAPGASAKASQNGGQTGDQNGDQNGDRTAGQNGHDVATKAEPEAGDETITEDTVTETADAGPAAKASGGSSLFDDPSDPDDAEPATTGADRTPQEEAGAARPTSSGGSLFDVDEADEDRAKPAPAAEPASEPELDASSKTGGSLFDFGDDEPAAEPAAKADPEPEPRSEAGTPAEAKTPAEEPAAAGSAPQTDLGGGGSLLDIQEEEPDPKAESEREPQVEVEPEPEVQPEPESAADAAPEVDLGGGGSLFDIQEDQPEASSEPEPQPEIESEVAPEVEAGPGPTESEPPVEAPDPVVASSFPGSLFDIASPDTGAGPATPAEPAAQQPAPDGPVVAASSGGSLFDVATPGAQPEAESPADEPADEGAKAHVGAEVDDRDEEPATQPVEEKPGPAASGESHTPKTDVDISDAGSLFDL